MKKKNIDFDAEFWDCHIKHSDLTLMEAFFRMDDLTTVKDHWFELMNYAVKHEAILKEDPALIFNFYLCLRSFLKAAYVLQFKKELGQLNDPPELTSKLALASLSAEEYNSPLLVFKNAFTGFYLKKLRVFYHGNRLFFFQFLC